MRTRPLSHSEPTGHSPAVHAQHAPKRGFAPYGLRVQRLLFLRVRGRPPGRCCVGFGHIFQPRLYRFHAQAQRPVPGQYDFDGAPPVFTGLEPDAQHRQNHVRITAIHPLARNLQHALNARKIAPVRRFARRLPNGNGSATDQSGVRGHVISVTGNTESCTKAESTSMIIDVRVRQGSAASSRPSSKRASCGHASSDTRSIFAPTAVELAHDVFVPAVQVVHAAHFGFASSAARPARIKDTEARKSVAMTGAPLSFCRPLSPFAVAAVTLRSRAPMRISSGACIKRFSKDLSLPAPTCRVAVHNSAIICACKSVGKPGNGSVVTFDRFDLVIGAPFDL